MGHGWHWWFQTDAGLLARIAIGAAIFAGLALADVLKQGRNASRWREYLFLIVASAVAMVYGLINDFIAASISWEYFYYGKGLGQVLGPHVPPAFAQLHWQACKVGLKATWSAGLITGVALLLANNPRPSRKQLSYQLLTQWLPAIFGAAAVFAVLGGIVGHAGLLTWTSVDLQMLVKDQLFRPSRFLTVYGMNLGGYAGGLLGTATAVVWIVRQRRRASVPLPRDRHFLVG